MKINSLLAFAHETPSQGGHGSQSNRNHRREARTRAEEPEEFLSRASPKRVRRAFALLTRTNHGCRQLGSYSLIDRFTTARLGPDKSAVRPLGTSCEPGLRGALAQGK